MAPTTRGGPNTPINNTNPNNMTPESIQAMIDQALLRNATNGDGSHSSHGDNRRNVQTARPCFYADFMKCQPLNFKGAEGVVGLTRWIEKMESVFHISGCAVENQVKFATCTLLGAALTWWNGQLRTLGPEAYTMTWDVLKQKMTNKYCPQGEIKKLEIELWNLKVKGNDVPAYTERFQELTLICTKFVANETEKVDKYLSGLPDNIYGNVKAAKPKTLDEIIELANDLMDRKLLTYAERQSDNKRRSTGNTNVANSQKGNGATPKGNGCLSVEIRTLSRVIVQNEEKMEGNGNAKGCVYELGNVKKRGNAQGNPLMRMSSRVHGQGMPGLFRIQISSRRRRKSGMKQLEDVPIVEISQEYFRDLPGYAIGTDKCTCGLKLEHEEHLKNILELLSRRSLEAYLGPGQIRGYQDWHLQRHQRRSDNFSLAGFYRRCGVNAVEKKVKAYASRQLKIGSREELHHSWFGAWIGSVCPKDWRHYLYGENMMHRIQRHKSLQHILDKKELKLEANAVGLDLLSDYDCDIVIYHREANVVGRRMSHKERVEPIAGSGLSYDNLFGSPKRILELRSKAQKPETHRE
ncbi:putative reverse transcriptase domain-containing protein [Tanacetum coccineum]